MQQDAARAEARHAATRTYLAGLIAACILGIAAGLGGPAALAARPAVATATPTPAAPTPTPTSHRDTPSPTRSATATGTPCPSCPTATATVTPACSGSWQIVGSPDPPGLGAGLAAAGGVAPDDLWAAGSSISADSTVHPLIEHGDGTGWTIVPGPALADQGALQALAAVDVDDVWAAGQHDDGTIHPLIAHWDANAWAVVPSPDAPGRQIYALAAAGPADVWAAGSGGLAEHWDGAAWSIVPTGTSADLWALAALGPADVWAVGGSGNDTLTLHWDGSAWATVASPNLGTGHNELRGITAIAANDIWAAGSYQTDVAYYRTLLLHWDGATWTATAGPNVGAGDNSLVGIRAAGPADIWAAGEYFDTTTYRPLTLHWDGATWTTVAAPGEGGLESLVAFGAGNVWATGYHWSPSSAGTLVEQWTIPCLVGHADAHGHAADRNAEPHGHPHADNHAHRGADPHAHGDADAHGDGHADGDAEPHLDRDRHAAHGDAHPDGDVDAAPADRDADRTDGHGHATAHDRPLPGQREQRGHKLHGAGHVRLHLRLPRLRVGRGRGLPDLLLRGRGDAGRALDRPGPVQRATHPAAWGQPGAGQLHRDDDPGRLLLLPHPPGRQQLRQSALRHDAAHAHLHPADADGDAELRDRVERGGQPEQRHGGQRAERRGGRGAGRRLGGRHDGAVLHGGADAAGALGRQRVAHREQPEPRQRRQPAQRDRRARGERRLGRREPGERGRRPDVDPALGRQHVDGGAGAEPRAAARTCWRGWWR